MAAPELAPIFAGFAPYLQTSAEAALESIRDLRARNVGQLLEEAADSSGRPVPDLIQAIASHEPSIQALAAAIESAARTSTRQKIRALGLSVARIANEPSAINSEELWIRIFAQIEAPHLLVLTKLLENQHGAHPGTSANGAWIAEVTGLGPLSTQVMLTLEGIGVIREDPNDGGLNFGPGVKFGSRAELTPLAFELFERIGVDHESRE
jgi:hypothetical protein